MAKAVGVKKKGGRKPSGPRPKDAGYKPKKKVTSLFVSTFSSGQHPRGLSGARRLLPVCMLQQGAEMCAEEERGRGAGDTEAARRRAGS